MMQILHSDVAELLTEKQEVDPKAGIIIVKLDISSVIADFEQPYEFYAARVLPRFPTNPGYENPHYHMIGREPFFFFSGKGEMNIGDVRLDTVVWEDRVVPQWRSFVVVEGGEVHSLRNTGTESLDFLFACPATHLCETDRFFTKELPNGTPSWYAKD